MQHKSLHKLVFIVTLFFSLFFTTKVQAQRIYVDSASTAGTNNGTSWANAYTNFAAAVIAAPAGDTIWVAKGTYQPASNASFTLETGVAIYGGFAGTETTLSARNWTTNVTILDGNGAAVISNNGSIGYSAVLDGFIITKGSGGIYGGGMYNANSSPTLNNLIFSNNTAEYGGGIYNNGTASPILTNVTFSNNTATVTGGGIYNTGTGSPTLNNVIFSNNSSPYGGGMMNSGEAATLINVIFSNNTATGNGGGMYNSVSSPTLNNVTFSNNTSTAAGGMFNVSSSPTITNCVFWVIQILIRELPIRIFIIITVVIQLLPIVIHKQQLLAQVI